MFHGKMWHTAFKILSNVLPRTYNQSCRHEAFSTQLCSGHSFLECSSASVQEIAMKDLHVMKEFISADEEQSLLQDIEPKWNKLKYQEGHWDNAIQGYRETEGVAWANTGKSVIDRIRSVAFKTEDVQRDLVHVLDLSSNGFIKPHVDSIKFCGRIIAGLSLLSPCVMKFIKEDDKDVWFKALLDRRSLYIMRDRVRYEFSHEVLKNEDSYFNGRSIPKGRRISVLCRSQPQTDLNADSIFQSVAIPLDEES